MSQDKCLIQACLPLSVRAPRSLGPTDSFESLDCPALVEGCGAVRRRDVIFVKRNQSIDYGTTTWL
eukprot:CAMPEP_0198370146 /NCGR_PEP_ID=MMETSP1450-20131203/156568_1 /TAXON_ID=753684 ORGANISM="Madagascaria erythrocladiodes, Strain CCMP3234" /NCGR_SAMPLE_ID=MMETSP1450 /ASSEMBLY_ACC=CAM_ASM_001115 /LENGTH=65 /DNA_ID=CAMNT_0044077681 /DNA_START=904 /DNA_END=1101 /DNA_ORIENTATION=-